MTTEMVYYLEALFVTEEVLLFGCLIIGGSSVIIMSLIMLCKEYNYIFLIDDNDDCVYVCVRRSSMC
jgi:hypothetical protein